MRRWIEAVAICLVFSPVAFGSNGLGLKGKVTDATGKPIEHATVMIYHAGVKHGYSTFCPSCYADCGKRSFTDATGTYTFTNLNADLWFELVVVHDGFAPVFTSRVDPSSGAPNSVVLNARPKVDNPKQTVLGRVVDQRGNPLRDVVVQPKGLAGDRGATYGTLPGLDPLSISNAKGEFEVNYAKPTSEMLLLVEARNKAPKYVVMRTGSERHLVELGEGAVIQGRLVKDGQPVGGAEVGLIARVRGGYGDNFNLVGNPYEEVRVGTQEDGSFVITNVPLRVEWYVYGKMESLLGRGATEPMPCETGNKQWVDVGDIEVNRGHHLEGQVILADGKPIPGGTRIVIGSDRVWDFQTVTLDSGGEFKFIDLSEGTYSINVTVRGYAPRDGAVEVPVSVERDVESFKIVLASLVNVPEEH